MQRRDFLKTAAVVPGMAAAAGPLPKRPYRDGIQLSVIGFGGIVVMGLDQKDAGRIVAESFDRGVNYFDVAPSYGDGEAETKLGEALRPFRSEGFPGMQDHEARRRGRAHGTRAFAPAPAHRPSRPLPVPRCHHHEGRGANLRPARSR